MKTRNEILQIRLSKADKCGIALAAKRAGASISSWTRERLIAALQLAPKVPFVPFEDGETLPPPAGSDEARFMAECAAGVVENMRLHNGVDGYASRKRAKVVAERVEAPANKKDQADQRVLARAMALQAVLADSLAVAVKHKVQADVSVGGGDQDNHVEAPAASTTKRWLPELRRLRALAECDPAGAMETFAVLMPPDFQAPKGWVQWPLEKQARWLEEHASS